jgi:hypothetical protein
MAVQPPGDACGSDRDAPDEGFYDQEDPPEGYDDEGWAGAGTPPAEPLQAAYWLPYDRDEQLAWLDTVTRIAARGPGLGDGEPAGAGDRMGRTKMGGNSTPGGTLQDKLRAVLEEAKAYDDAMCDVANGGAHSRPPTGDDYNHLFGLLLDLETALSAPAASPEPRP